MKTKTINLVPEMSFGELTGYRVIRITDSVEFTPGSTITKAKAEELCDAKGWKVTVDKAKG